MGFDVNCTDADITEAAVEADVTAGTDVFIEGAEAVGTFVCATANSNEKKINPLTNTLFTRSPYFFWKNTQHDALKLVGLR